MKNLGNSEDRASGRRWGGWGGERGEGGSVKEGIKEWRGRGQRREAEERPPSAGPVGPYLSLSLSLARPPPPTLRRRLAGAPISSLIRDKAFPAVASRRHRSRSSLRRCYLFVISVFFLPLCDSLPPPSPPSTSSPPTNHESAP